MARISIVLPSYNGEQYIKESIDSIIEQTFSDWELIIVDDCSTDKTGEIAEEYARSDARITVIHNKKNEKLPMALNIGFREARGDYYTWTSDDNRYLRGALSAMFNYLEDNPQIDMVCTNMLFFDDKWNYLREHTGYDVTTMYLEDTVGASFMYRRELALRIGDYDPEMFCVEDYDYWIRILKMGARIGYLDGVYYMYRLHNASLTIAKKNVVSNQRRLLYKRHFEWVVKGIEKDIDKILYLYGEFVKIPGMEHEEIKVMFSKYLPEIRFDFPFQKNDLLCIFGAGNMGKYAVDRLSDFEIKWIIDSRAGEETMGIGNIPIIPPTFFFSEYAKNPKLHVIIAVSEEKQFEIIKMLELNGVKKFSVLAHIDRYRVG